MSSPQVGARSRWVFVAVALSVTSAGPLHYYLLRDDPRDERFAWRMFSPTRLDRCEVAFSSGEGEIPLPPFFHGAWIDLARRGRRDVVRAMAEQLCAQSELRRAGVFASVECRRIDRTRETVFDGEDDLCEP